MAEPVHATFDTSGWEKGLDKLTGDLKVSLARSMAVAGGQVLRDEAKELAPVGTEEGGSIHPGALRDSIYLVYKQNRSGAAQQVYSVTWNKIKAPHGHLIEFGHWQPYVVVRTPGGYYTTKEKKDVPTWTPAHPFLRPALSIAGEVAQRAMIERGRVRLPELLAGNTGNINEP